LSESGLSDATLSASRASACQQTEHEDHPPRGACQVKTPSFVRLLRYYLLDQSEQAHYSADAWQRRYSVEHYERALSLPEEDGRFGAMIAVLRRYDRGGPMLDAGCGDGLLWQEYRPFTESRLIGVDYAPAAVEKALSRRIPNAVFWHGDYRTFRAQERFSVVVFNESLYYSDEYLSVLASMEKALKPDGVLVISMWHNAITRRMWRRVEEVYHPVQAVKTIDEGSRKRWRLAVYPPRSQGR
jgi:SAM-dependent methyltransferase